MDPLRVKLLADDAVPPRRATPDSAGYDLFARATATIPPRERACIPTGVAIALPPRTYGRVAPRSGLALRHGIVVMAGVIDGDYRGEIGVLLANLGDRPFEVAAGDRVAQLIVEAILLPEVLVVDDLDATSRGGAGFGSTGT